VAHLRRRAAIGQPLADAVEGSGQVSVDVVCEGLQRRDVETVDGVVEATVSLTVEQFVDDGGEGGERLAAARRRTDEGVPPLVDEGDGLALWRREEAAVFRDERPELLDPPVADGGVEAFEHVRVGGVGGDALRERQIGQPVGVRVGPVHRPKVGADDQVGCAGRRDTTVKSPLGLQSVWQTRSSPS